MPADERGAPAPQRSPSRPLLDLLGLAARARGLVAGTDQVRKSVRGGEVRRVIIAADAAPTQQQKLIPLLDARRVPYHTVSSREALGSAIGRAPVAAVGITNPNFARRAAELIAALPASQD